MPDLTEQVVNLCKRRGFVFPSSEIYGGFRSTYDYGPLGVLLKRNVMDAWWRVMVQERDDIVGLDAAVLMAPKVWEASATSRRLPTRWSIAASATSAGVRTRSRARAPTADPPTSPR